METAGVDSHILYHGFHLLLRWLHVIAGITWIGHLYFFNFVNVQLQGALNDDGKKTVNPQLMPRALFWFRWGAMVTFIAGLILFTINYMYTPGVGFGPSPFFEGSDGITPRAWWIMIGSAFGTVMWFNVWFIIWPAQKRILGINGQAKAPAEELPALRAKAAKFSRVNTFLSGPMLVGMLAAPHFGFIGWGSFLVFTAVAMFTVSGAYKLSASAGKIA